MEISEIAFVLLAVAVAYLVKGATGLGGPTIAVPVLAPFMGVEFAVAVIAIPTVFSNVWLVWENRSQAPALRRFLAPLLAAGLVGTIIGVLVLVSIDDRIMSVILGVIIFLYIAWYLLSPEAKVDDETAVKLAWPAGLGGGVLLGSTGIGAPVIATYVHSLRMARSGFVFGVSVPFLVLGAVQIITLTALGSYDQERVVAGLAACIPVLLVTPVGMWAGKRISVRAFQYAVLVILGVSAVRLLWAGMG
jgi:uncharacterized membrane protein YfcA